MNIWQTTRQIKYLLRNRKWEGNASNDVVWPDGSVAITNKSTWLYAVDTMITPMALIMPENLQSDPQHGEEPDLMARDVTIRLCAMVPGDALGEGLLVGKNRDSLTKSEGRGLLEMEPELFGAVKRLLDIDGIRMIFRGQGGQGHNLWSAQTQNWIGYIDYVFAYRGTADRYYHAPFSLAATDAGSGNASLTWKLPFDNLTDRYDAYKVRLIRKANTAPTSVTDGTELTLAAADSTSHTDAAGTGTWGYTVFISYDELNVRPDNTPSTSERNSEVETGSSTTVAVA